MMKNNEQTDYRKGLRKKILTTAMTLFKEKGVKAVKMDDIANSLTISKRTLYEIYDNKEVLLLEGVKNDMAMQHQEMLEFGKTHADVLQIVLHFYRIKLMKIGCLHPDYIFDLRKFKKVAAFLEQNKAEQKKRTLEFFMRGVDEGYFLPQFNYDIVTRLGEAAMDYVVATKMYDEYSLREIFKNIVSVLLRGYCTGKGQAMLDAELWNEE